MSSRGGIGVISNPLSGRNRKNPRVMRRLAYVLGERGELALPEGLDRLEAEIRVFHERGIDVLCINGGDGTIHQVMTALYAVYGDDEPFPKIALLKGGTMNTIARNVGVRTAAEDMLGRVASRYHAGVPLSTTQRCLMIINDRRAGFIYGNAGIAHFLEEYYAGGDSSPWKAVKVLTRAIVSSVLGTEYAGQMFRLIDMDITLDGSPLSHTAYTTVGISTVADLGFGFRPFYQVYTHPRHLHLIGVAEPVWALTASLLKIRMARPTNRPHTEDHVALDIRLQAAEPVAYTIDGDMYPGEQTMSFRAGPAVTFITG
ncbi:MAG: diacylglycerol kinase (ATP) [Myxococcota bacterium]